MNQMKWFGRDPAVILSIVAAALGVLVAFGLGITDAVAVAIMAVLYAGSDFLTAVIVRSDRQLPAFIGLAEAGLALLLVFGIQFSAEQTSAIMALATLVTGMFVRTQVVAPTPSEVKQ
jgi:hypothetical protein